MANWISLSPQGQSHVNAISSAWNNAKDNWNNAKSTAVSNFKNDLSGDLGRIQNGTWMTTAKDNKPVSEALDELLNPSSGYGGGEGGGFPVAAAADPYKAAMDMIKDVTKANNEWSAAQAQKQMDFQREMSDTAHQREVLDLQKAGLNPVLSAGGSGASTPSGAMGDTDTTGTHAIAQIALEAIDAMASTAQGVAGVAGSAVNQKSNDSFFGKLNKFYTSNKLGHKLIDTGLGLANTAASSAVRYNLIKAILR